MGFGLGEVGRVGIYPVRRGAAPKPGDLLLEGSGKDRQRVLGLVAACGVDDGIYGCFGLGSPVDRPRQVFRR